MDYEMTAKCREMLNFSYLIDEKILKPQFILSRFPHLESIDESWCLAESDDDLFIRHATWQKFSGEDSIKINDIRVTMDEFITILDGFNDMVLLDDTDSLKGIYDGPHYKLSFLDINLNKNRCKAWIGDKTFEYLKHCFSERLIYDLGFSRCG